MGRLLRVLYEYPGVGRSGELVDETDVEHSPQALVDAGIAEWADAGRNDVVVETTDAVPVRETTSATPVKRGPGRPPRRASTGGDNAV